MSVASEYRGPPMIKTTLDGRWITLVGDEWVGVPAWVAEPIARALGWMPG